MKKLIVFAWILTIGAAVADRPKYKIGSVECSHNSECGTKQTCDVLEKLCTPLVGYEDEEYIIRE